MSLLRNYFPRVLICGSRDFRTLAAARWLLERLPLTTTLVYEDQQVTKRIIEKIARERGLRIVTYQQVMPSLEKIGVDFVAAFLSRRGNTHTTRAVLRKASKAKLPVFVYQESFGVLRNDWMTVK